MAVLGISCFSGGAPNSPRFESDKEDGEEPRIS